MRFFSSGMGIAGALDNFLFMPRRHVTELAVRPDGSVPHAAVHDELLQSGRPFLLAVFADWCYHCNRLSKPQRPGEASHWDRFVAGGSAVPVVRLDYDAYRSLTSDARFKDCALAKVLRNSVSGFPHVAMVKTDAARNEINVLAYNGSYPIDAAGLAAFVDRSVTASGGSPPAQSRRR